MSSRILAASRVFAVLQFLMGLIFFVGGTQLLWLGGSWYYVTSGLGAIVSGVLLWRARIAGVAVQLGVFALTVVWALWEAGFSFWPQVPRLVLPAVLTVLALLLAPSLVADESTPRYRLRHAQRGVAFLLTAALAATLAAAFQPHGVTSKPTGRSAGQTTLKSHSVSAGPSDWTHYGRRGDGNRFAPFDQIDRTNVRDLQVAWTFRTGDVGPGEDQNVPLQIGDVVYTCSRNNLIAALDADTGEVRWRFDPKAKSPVWQRCRGLGYHDAGSEVPPRPGGADRTCRRRILQTTIDARLIALDAGTGSLCDGFGLHGTVYLSQGMGPVKPGFYFQTSAPTVVQNLIVIGGWVRDNQERGEPSGVIRAFDVHTGALVWAWDLGNDAITKEPPAGQSYTRGTPNMWSTPSFDNDLGLLYLPLGNATPDYFGEGRTPESEHFSSSIVALDIATGRLRWRFQTVHHDLWDYDVGSQPALFDAPDGKGGVIPALLQTTKRGQLFLLDRRTGESISEIVEKSVPQTGMAPTEWLAKTQPYSIGMPSIGTDRLTETRMWGATPFDQLWCRIRFRQLRYDGDFTPPGLTESIEYPGNYGGFNWGSVSLDAGRGLAFMNDIRLPVTVRLMPPDETREVIASAAKSSGIGNRHGPAMQAGTPYGVIVQPMMSPLGIPCNEPPFGTMTAIDLKTRQVAWQVPMGTVRDTGPLGLRTQLKMPLGMPTIGGTLATASGLIFFAGTQDFYLRALDATDGKELWSARLPVGSGSSPMTYISPNTGRQYVVISAGGASGSMSRGDYVIAYALPATVSR